jgi:hypothetical protein
MVSCEVMEKVPAYRFRLGVEMASQDASAAGDESGDDAEEGRSVLRLEGEVEEEEEVSPGRS